MSKVAHTQFERAPRLDCSEKASFSETFGGRAEPRLERVKEVSYLNHQITAHVSGSEEMLIDVAPRAQHRLHKAEVSFTSQ
ncbi:hypothetical protein scyTo_0014626 [Scyliorhinus torazame]|uniref:Uncharacterized protein n=1 Tax=Scyliorhinus torazame TaxID=75743 RepID=A0A401NRB8_SCYTO|nr:hypothetical protein [Scyliorhinus torazame]